MRLEKSHSCFIFVRILLLTLDNHSMCLYFSAVLANKDKVVQKARIYTDQLVCLLEAKRLQCPRTLFAPPRDQNPFKEMCPEKVERTFFFKKQRLHLKNLAPLSEANLIFSCS